MTRLSVGGNREIAGTENVSGVERPHKMIDDLLRKHFSSYRAASS